MKRKVIALIAFFIATSVFSHHAFATQIELIPEAKGSDPAKIADCIAGMSGTYLDVNCSKWTVQDRYSAFVKQGKMDLGTMFATGVFSWDAIKLLLSHTIRFLSQIWLLVGAIMIIVAWYKYATAVYKWSDPGKKDIVNAIVGVLIVIFSFAIIRILQSASWIG